MDHSAIQRRAVHYAPRFETVLRKTKERTGLCGRLDETHLKTKGQRKYLYRVADMQGKTIDLLLTAQRDKI